MLERNLKKMCVFSHTKRFRINVKKHTMEANAPCFARLWSTCKVTRKRRIEQTPRVLRCFWYKKPWGGNGHPVAFTEKTRTFSPVFDFVPCFARLFCLLFPAVFPSFSRQGRSSVFRGRHPQKGTVRHVKKHSPPQGQGFRGPGVRGSGVQGSRGSGVKGSTGVPG